MCLIDANVGNMNTRISPYAYYLRNSLTSSDVSVMELVAKTMASFALVYGSKAPEYVAFEVKTALEWLSGDRVEVSLPFVRRLMLRYQVPFQFQVKRHAAVLVLKEFATALPTYFYQQVSQFFDNIFVAIQDPKQAIREAAIEALRAALVITAQRENAKDNQRGSSSW